jgi:putative ABC transport system permease protein
MVHEFRQAGRSLRRNPRLTAVAILVLALGIGGNTTVFSLVNALLLNPFPYPHADRLVEIESRYQGGSWHPTVPVGDFADWREQSTSYEAMSAYGWARADLTGQSLPGFNGPESIVIGRATDAFLRVLGVTPALGRFFTADEDRPGGPPVVVLGYGAWVRRFGRAAEVLGQTVTLDDRVYTIIGVMPARLVLPGTFTCEVWLPAAYDFATNRQPGYNTRYDGDHVVARLEPDVPRDRAQAEMSVITGRLAREHPQRTAGWEARVGPLGRDLADEEGTRLHVLSLIVATGLLLVCANLAGLLLAKSGARSKEMAVRAALGASRGRLVRDAMLESVLLALCGGGIGLALAAWGIRAIGNTAPAYLGLDSALRIDLTVLAFAFGASMLTGVTFGLVPALQGSKLQLTTVLKGNSGSSRAWPRGRILSAVVVGEVSLALLLLVGGGLMTRSLIGLMNVDTGLRPEGVLTFRVSLPGSRYDSEASRTAFFETLLGGLRAMPQVFSAAAVSPLPMSREYSSAGFAIEGRPAPANPREMMAQFCQASPGYFRTMGIPLLAGREFDESDGPAQPVVVINNALARRFFTNEDPVGQRISRLGTIVGVVGDVRHDGPAAEPGPQIYYPVTRRPARTLSIVLRATGDPLALVPAVWQQVRTLDADLPLDRLAPMAAVITGSMANERILTGLVGGFAVFALVLAAIGLYGIVAYSVSQRRQEIGVRLALGASPGDVRHLVLTQGAGLALVGILIGLPIALATVRLMASFLHRLSPYDPQVFAAVPMLLLVVALVASYVPARHATRIDPLDSLRSE